MQETALENLKEQILRDHVVSDAPLRGVIEDNGNNGIGAIVQALRARAAESKHGITSLDIGNRVDIRKRFNGSSIIDVLWLNHSIQSLGLRVFVYASATPNESDAIKYRDPNKKFTDDADVCDGQLAECIALTNDVRRLTLSAVGASPRVDRTLWFVPEACGRLEHLCLEGFVPTPLFFSGVTLVAALCPLKTLQLSRSVRRSMQTQHSWAHALDCSAGLAAVVYTVLRAGTVTDLALLDFDVADATPLVNALTRWNVPHRDPRVDTPPLLFELERLDLSGSLRGTPNACDVVYAVAQTSLARFACNDNPPPPGSTEKLARSFVYLMRLCEEHGEVMEELGVARTFDGVDDVKVLMAKYA